MLFFTTASIRGLILTVPSRIEYSEWTRRCINEAGIEVGDNSFIVLVRRKQVYKNLPYVERIIYSIAIKAFKSMFQRNLHFLNHLV
tara:strand:+ start:856 stop:1113 length:258 start_codon:yes stop_codon:yes gene_type:complete